MTSKQTKATFTPGPWFYDHNHPGEIRYGKGYASDVICRMERGDWEQLEANAHLIAMAPELLEALKACVKRLKLGCYSPTTDLLVSMKIEDLIRKAEGQEVEGE